MISHEDIINAIYSQYADSSIRVRLAKDGSYAALAEVEGVPTMVYESTSQCLVQGAYDIDDIIAPKHPELDRRFTVLLMFNGGEFIFFENRDYAREYVRKLADEQRAAREEAERLERINSLSNTGNAFNEFDDVLSDIKMVEMRTVETAETVETLETVETAETLETFFTKLLYTEFSNIEVSYRVIGNRIKMDKSSVYRKLTTEQKQMITEHNAKLKNK